MKKLLLILLLLCSMQSFAQSNLVTAKNQIAIRYHRLCYTSDGGTTWIPLADSSAAGGGSMVYPGAGIALSTGSAWATSITDNSTNWNTVLNRVLYTDTAAMLSPYARKNFASTLPFDSTNLKLGLVDAAGNLRKGNWPTAAQLGVVPLVASSPNSSSANGMLIGVGTPGDIHLTFADLSNPGIISTSSQNITGVKFYNNDAYFATGNTTHGIRIGSGNVTSSTNLALGDWALKSTSIGNGGHLTAIGTNALSLMKTGGTTTALGSNAGTNDSLGINGLYLGSYAGKYNGSDSNTLFINTIDRGSKSNDSLLSLIYGKFASTAANQYLRINSRVRLSSLGSASADTSTYKPVGINSSGDILPMPAWYGTSSGGGAAPYIGQPITSAAYGSLLFAGSSGKLSQNNNDLFYDSINKRLGINTAATPLDFLHIKGVNSNGITLEGINPTITINRTGGTDAFINLGGASLPSYVFDRSGDLYIYGYNRIKNIINGVNGYGYYNYLGPGNNIAFSIGSASAPTSTLQSYGSFAGMYVAKSANYTATDYDHTIECTTGTFTVTLPTAVGITGRFYTIVNSGAGVITIATTSSQTFVNVVTTPTTLTMSSLGTMTVQSNGANWMKISSL